MKTQTLVALFVALLPLRGQSPEPVPAPALTHGPLRGHVDGTSMHVWARANGGGRYTLRCQPLIDAKTIDVEAVAEPAHDCTLHFVVTGLEPGQAYDVEIRAGDTVVGRSGGLPWTTALPDDSSAAVVAFGSCSNDKAFPEQPIWGRILARSPHALVLLGDTPYIDLGTTEGRQRRHREFLAFPPVRATLAAIPTWTTWDDHDYATNDTFGAAAGSETARAVFVDYHAHAGYGDGATGIWTSFRRGPIEVFLLDARSAADRGESVLAPGQRTLLGPVQIAWLQQGLRSSTAPIKVLACGMVWNDGVRPNKQDCWGNWLPERDALFAWLGKERIDGVVLVSGDVHRSRVILHPTKAVVGYDLPELVTSPLAQNVLESNAVRTPGLVFDAGEPQSCLFLEAVRGPIGPTLRVVFQAGCGREFHCREFGPAALRGGDAAVVYRQIVAGLQARFGPEVELPAAEPVPVLGLAEADACGPDWRAAVAAARLPLDAWLAVVAEEQCRFARESADPMDTEFVHTMSMPIRQLQLLGCAAALQAIADRQPARLEALCGAALATARHLQQEPGLLAWFTAIQSEQQAIELGARAAALGPAVVAVLRAQLAEHARRRAGLDVLHRAVRTELRTTFDAALAQLRLDENAMGQAARQFEAAVQRGFMQWAEPLLRAFEAVTAAGDDAGMAALRRLMAELSERRKTQMEALKRLQTAKSLPAGVDAGAELGFVLATMLLPNLEQVLLEEFAARAALQAASR
jgi:alkaline phosphatase D